MDAPLDAPTTTPFGVATVSHVCLNDDVVEGLELRSEAGDLKAFSVQYHRRLARLRVVLHREGLQVASL